VDNATRAAVLHQEGNLPGVAESLGIENDVSIAKTAWLSRKDIGKAYGSMLVYVTKGSDATRLLQGQYFHNAGESAYTRVFEPRYGPQQCQVSYLLAVGTLQWSKAADVEGLEDMRGVSWHAQRDNVVLQSTARTPWSGDSRDH
jgi:hypothetical protein